MKRIKGMPKETRLLVDCPAEDRKDIIVVSAPTPVMDGCGRLNFKYRNKQKRTVEAVNKVVNVVVYDDYRKITIKAETILALAKVITDIESVACEPISELEAINSAGCGEDDDLPF